MIEQMKQLPNMLISFKRPFPWAYFLLSFSKNKRVFLLRFISGDYKWIFEVFRKNYYIPEEVKINFWT